MSSTLPGTTFVLLFDGTGNFFREETTNIIRLFEAPENDDAEKQLLYYQPGVGKWLLSRIVHYLNLIYDTGTYVSPSTLWASTFCSIAKWTDKAVAWLAPPLDVDRNHRIHVHPSSVSSAIM